jgi:hypothetical protein
LLSVQHREARERALIARHSLAATAGQSRCQEQGSRTLDDFGKVARRPVPSDSCHLADLLEPVYLVADSHRQPLDLQNGWMTRWTAQLKVAGETVRRTVRDLAAVPVAGLQPVRAFSWHTNQRHRPGLAYMVSTGGLHGFESIAEYRLLLALDFCGKLTDVASQPMKITFYSLGSSRGHTPDFLATTTTGTLLIDVRPAPLIRQDDRIKFAAAAEVALACGWQYIVVAGWRRQVMETIEDLSAARRPLSDLLGAEQQILREAAGGPCPFGQVVAAASYPAIARAHAVRLLWTRRLGIDLSMPLTDKAPVWQRAGDPAC